MKRALALALAALLLVPLAPLSRAEAPVAETWAPYDTGASVNAVAIAGSGTTIAAALREVPPPTGAGGSCTPQPPLPTCLPSGTPGAPNTEQPDLVILTPEGGHVRNGTGNIAVNGRTHAYGRSLVAVAQDGRTLASVGLDATPSPTVPTAGDLGGSSPTALKLYVDGASGANFSSGDTNGALYLPGVRAAGLALSDDGKRVAVLTDDGAGNLTLSAYNLALPSITPAFQLSWPGTARALSADSTLARLFVGGDLVAPANATLASVVLVNFAAATSVGTYQEAVNGTSVASLTSTRDGAMVVLGTSAGRLLLLDGPTMTLATAYQAGPVTASLSPLSLSADGTHLAVGSGGNLTAFAIHGRAPSLLWNTSLDGTVNSLAYNATGAILAAGVNGSAGGAYAFGDDASTPFWSVPGEVRSVAIDDAGLVLAYGQSHTVQAQRIVHAFTLGLPSGQKTGPVRPLRAGASAVFDLVVTNHGAAPETYDITATHDAFLTITSSPPVLSVRPGEAKHVNVSLASTPLFTGLHAVNVTATARSDGTQDNATLGVSFEGVANVTFQVNQTEFLVVPGVPMDALLTIVNNGTTSAAVGLRYAQSVSAGPQWSLVVDQPSFVVPQGAISTVKVRVTPPLQTANGTSDSITFTLEGPNVSDQTVLSFRVNPHLAVDITAARRVQFVEPTHIAFFNVTVSNTGSLTRDFTVLADQTPTNNRPWTIEMPTAPFRLEPGALRTVAIRVTAPGDATPTDSTKIVVRARSIANDLNETPVEANLTLFADAVAPQVTSTTPTGNPIPFPALLMVAACVALAAIARRRRNA